MRSAVLQAAPKRLENAGVSDLRFNPVKGHGEIQAYRTPMDADQAGGAQPSIAVTEGNPRYFVCSIQFREISTATGANLLSPDKRELLSEMVQERRSTPG